MRRKLKLTSIIECAGKKAMFIFADDDGKEYEIEDDGSREMGSWRSVLTQRLKAMPKSYWDGSDWKR